MKIFDLINWELWPDENRIDGFIYVEGKSGDNWYTPEQMNEFEEFGEAFKRTREECEQKPGVVFFVLHDDGCGPRWFPIEFRNKI